MIEELEDVGDGIIATHHHLSKPRPVTSLRLWNIEVMHKSKCTLYGHLSSVISWPNVKVMARLLAGANVDRGVRVEIR